MSLCGGYILTPKGRKMPCQSIKLNPVNNGLPCINYYCSHSSPLPHEVPLHSLVSKVVITKDCTSSIITKLKSYDLKPTQFKIDGQWQKVPINNSNN